MRLSGLLLLSLAGTASLAGQSTAVPPIRAATPEVYEAVRSVYEYNRKAPLLAESLARRDFPAYTREKIVFNGVQQSRVPGLLLIPKAGRRPYPVVILLHGITASKEMWFEPEGWAYGTRLIDPLTASGIAVLALDARYHGERGAEGGYRVPNDINEIRDFVVETVIEHRRALDYLATRDDIDTTRIGLLGLSMGGMETFALTAVDSRVRVAVAGVTPIGATRTFVTIPVAPQTFAGAIRTTPFLMLMGRNDEYYSVEDARQVFESISSPRKELVFYDSGHRMPPEYAAKAISWLAQYLK
jgi:alpha-beta hydrolase superfamily lysophospholipase